MEIISLKPFVILTLATSILLASKSVCADESMMSNLHDWERYDEYLKPIGYPKEKKQKSLNPAELWQWGSNTIHKVQTPITYKIPQLMPRLPLRFGRSFEEERSVEPVANSPLRFGKNFNGGISRRIPNLPQRFGRAAVKSVKESIIHLPQRLLGSPPAEQPSYPVSSQPRELQAADEGESRTLDFNDYFAKKADDKEASPE
ncbi:pro-FMRFamide-related neuropeptide VF [Trichosurus vulpecula]|uniref:pro-FMRFamide-related neuropeptide VF n=1 Tax=Trichosurus vulpecula TaxID=9337 RepID=UPI00186ABDEC|nr:pro-FMRFamide-related neuropeptide VF [Trichosurus vulpecula]